MKEYPFSVECPVRGGKFIATASHIVGKKWTPQILYAMARDVRRFGELQAAVGGVNPRTLSVRLDELEEAGIIDKKSFAEVPPRIEYTLTEKGQELLPILDHMVQWGERYTADHEVKSATVSVAA